MVQKRIGRPSRLASCTAGQKVFRHPISLNEDSWALGWMNLIHASRFEADGSIEPGACITARASKKVILLLSSRIPLSSARSANGWLDFA